MWNFTVRAVLIPDTSGIDGLQTSKIDKTLQRALKGAVSYYTHMLLRITNLKALGQRFQV